MKKQPLDLLYTSLLRARMARLFYFSDAIRRDAAFPQLSNFSAIIAIMQLYG
jgi:hypothetical protein